MLPKLQLRIIAALLIVTTVIIIGLAIYISSNFSGIESKEGLILFSIGVAALIIITVILVIFVKSIKKQ